MPAAAQSPMYQSLWQAESEATRRSSGFQRRASPLKTGSDEPMIVGFSGELIS